MVCRFLKGINNIKPSLPKYVFTWDVGKVVRYLSTMSCDNNPRNLSTKVVTLLAILSGQRAREILSVMDIRNTTVE